VGVTSPHSPCRNGTNIVTVPAGDCKRTKRTGGKRIRRSREEENLRKQENHKRPRANQRRSIRNSRSRIRIKAKSQGGKEQKKEKKGSPQPVHENVELRSPKKPDKAIAALSDQKSQKKKKGCPSLCPSTRGDEGRRPNAPRQKDASQASKFSVKGDVAKRRKKREVTAREGTRY